MTHRIFQVGEFVRLRNGWTKMIVTSVVTVRGERKVEAQYYRLDSEYTSAKRRPDSEFVQWTEGTNQNNFRRQPTEKRSSTMLYQTKEDKPQYGTYLATDSQGRVVLEMKGTPNGVRAFASDEIKEVIPYTFSARVVGADHEPTCHYSTKEGLVSVGDLLLSDSGNLYRVTELDTKNKSPKKEFRGCKLSTVRLDGGSQ